MISNTTIKKAGNVFAAISIILIALYLVDYKSWFNGSVSFVVHAHSPLVFLYLINFLGCIWLVVSIHSYFNSQKQQSKTIYIKWLIYITAMAMGLILYEFL